MKRFLFVVLLAVALIAVVAGTALAAPVPPYGRHMGPGYHGGHMGGYGMMGDGAMMHDDLEELLGLSHADIHEARVAGKSLVEIAAEQGISEEQLISALLDGRRAALAQAVAEGRLSQESADQMLEFMQANIEAMVNAQGMMGGYGMMHGNGGVRAGPCHGTANGGSRSMRFAPGWLIES